MGRQVAPQVFSIGVFKGVSKGVLRTFGTSYRLSGKKKKESFRIRTKEKVILIEYYALYDRSGKYKGTLEVSQDITEIQNLKGEKRLLTP